MIYLIITTSINNKIGIINEIQRKNRYIECINHLLKLNKNDSNIKPIIVENNGLRSTFLDEFNCDICYTENNFTNYHHKGENELLDIKKIIHIYNIKDDDIIIKITGRYKLLNLNFINLIKSYNYDVFIKFFNVCTKKYIYDDCVLGLFAIKCKYLKEFKYNFVKSPECEFADYIRKNIDNKKIKEIFELNLECCFADNLNFLIV